MTTAPGLYERLFEGFAPGEAGKVLTGSAPRVLRRGEVLFREGEPATALYLVESGRVKLTQLTAEGQGQRLWIRAPRDLAAIADGSGAP